MPTCWTCNKPLKLITQVFCDDKCARNYKSSSAGKEEKEAIKKDIESNYMPKGRIRWR